MTRTRETHGTLARDFNDRFPGFDTDIHGLVEEDFGGRKHYFVDCVAGAKVIAAVPPMTRVRSVRKS